MSNSFVFENFLSKFAVYCEINGEISPPKNSKFGNLKFSKIGKMWQFAVKLVLTIIISYLKMSLPSYLRGSFAKIKLPKADRISESFFHSRTLARTMTILMVSPVLPGLLLAAFSKKYFKFFRMSDEIPYFRRRKILYEKESKNKDRVTR